MIVGWIIFFCIFLWNIHGTNIQLLWQFHQRWSAKTWSSAVVRLSKVRTESSRRLQRTATNFHQVFDSLQNGTSISLPPKNQHLNTHLNQFFSWTSQTSLSFRRIICCWQPSSPASIGHRPELWVPGNWRKPFQNDVAKTPMVCLGKRYTSGGRLVL